MSAGKATRRHRVANLIKESADLLECDRNRREWKTSRKISQRERKYWKRCRGNVPATMALHANSICGLVNAVSFRNWAGQILVVFLSGNQPITEAIDISLATLILRLMVVIVSTIIFWSGVGLAALLWYFEINPTAPVLISLLAALAAAVFVFLRQRRDRPEYIVVDGSNVLHWENETPSIATVRDVLGVLDQLGYVPVVWFDANVGYKIGERYQGPRRLARQLGIDEDRVLVAPKGTPADPLLLDNARKLRARVVTNDRFRDWKESHPQIEEPEFLVRGWVRGDTIALEDLEPVTSEN